MKKKIFVKLIILIIIALIGVSGYFIYKKNKPIDPFELEWVRIYYDYMKENHESLKINQSGLKYYRENEKIQFCKVEGIEYPVMLYNYKELGVSFTNLFYINENKSVSILKSVKKDFDVECLYNIEEQKYEYYIHETYDDKNNYTKISDIIKINEGEINSEEIEENNIILTFELEEKETVTTIYGEVLEIYKFDEKFVQTDLVADNWRDINYNNYEDQIKKVFSEAVINMENIFTEDVKEEVSEKEEAVQIKKEEMKKALEEIEQKRKEEEEARKKAEEEARKKAEEEAKKKAEEEAKKKAEEEARKKAEEEARQREEEQEAANNRRIYIAIWNI